MSLLTLAEGKNYLRVDSSVDDELITRLLSSSEKLVADVARMTEAEWSAIGTDASVSIRDEALTEGETAQLKALLIAAVLFSLGYLYEHREDADHHDLVMTLRDLLSSVREGVF